MGFKKGNTLGVKHGHNTREKRTRSYNSWAKMIDRCFNKNSDCFMRYGGRGILVDDSWKSYENFFNDMGDRPEGTSLDRIDNSVGYNKKNCRWATPKEQQNNTRRNVLLSYYGETLNMAQWCEKLNIKRANLDSRLKLGWSFSDAIEIPFKKYNKRKVS